MKTDTDIEDAIIRLQGLLAAADNLLFAAVQALDREAAKAFLPVMAVIDQARDNAIEMTAP